MTDPCTSWRELLAADSLGELDAAGRERLEGHLAGCAACRALRETMREDDRRLSEFVDSTDAVLDRLQEGIMDKLNEAPTPTTRRNPLRSNGVRLALAAVIAVCAFLGLNWMTDQETGGVVWAEVIARVENAEEFICRRIEKRRGEPDQEMVEYRSARFGLRQDIYVEGKLQAEQYIIPAEKTLYALIHRDRTWMKQRMNDEQLTALRENGNAREMVASFKEYDYESLGRRKIDGRLAEGIEVRDPQEWQALFESGTWRLWVDLETQWPVKLELEGIARDGKVRKTYTLDRFRWNPDLKATDFAVEIPRDYELIADLAENRADEEHAIAGLRAYAQLVGGRYPSALSLSTAITEAEEELDRRHNSYDEAAGEDIESLFLIRNACDFFNAMDADDRDAVYHGDEVGPRDFDRVLMSWRLDDGRYRVVYGDLRSATMSAGELEERTRTR